MKLWIAITTAPRDNWTLKDVVDSIKHIDIHIFAEPSSEIIDYAKINYHQNKERKWCFGNRIYTLQEMVNLWYDVIWINQDDMVFEGDINEALKTVSDDIVVNMYTSIRQQEAQKILYKRWRNLNNRWRTTRWASFMMTRKVAKQILNHPLIKSHTIGYSKNQQVDSIVSAVISDLEIEHRLYNPSFTRHIGKQSTVEHTDFYVNQKVDQPSETVNAYVVWTKWSNHNRYERNFNKVFYFKPTEQKELIEAITHTPGYWFILSNTLAYSYDYVINSIRNIKQIGKDSILSYRYYTINSQWIEEKPAHIHYLDKQTRIVQYTHHWALSFYGAKIRGKEPTQYYKDINLTLNKFFQQHWVSIKTRQHRLWTINHRTKPSKDRTDTDKILQHKWYLII